MRRAQWHASFFCRKKVKTSHAIIRYCIIQAQNRSEEYVMDLYSFDHGIAQRDAARLQRFLRIFLKYAITTQFAFCGRLAIAYWTQKHGGTYPARPFNDVDIIARSVGVVSAHITRHMWVGYYEPHQYIALKHFPTGIKVDVFTGQNDYPSYPDKVVKVDFEGTTVQIVSLGLQLAKTIKDCWRVIREPVDPKQFYDAALMLQFVDKDELDLAWKRHYQDLFPAPLSWEEAWVEALTAKNQKPDHLVEHPFKKARSLTTKLSYIARFGLYTLKVRANKSSQW